MSGLVGRGQISFRKKIVAESLIPALGIKKVRLAGINAAAIAPVNGIITLPFANFVPPPEMVAEGFSNPSSTEIVNLRLGQFRNNVQVSSNLNGVLLDQIAYTITDESLILQDSYMVTAGEIFVLTIDSNPVTCQRVVDARPLRASGTVDFSTIGSAPVTFPVGQGYRVAQSAVNSAGQDEQQIGNVQVFVDGVLQLRNAGNLDEDSTPATMQTGNYREIAINSSGTIIAGVDYANAIRFNQFQPFSATEGVLIVATNVIVDEPNGTGVLSLLDNIEMGVATNTTELATIPTAVGATPADILQVNAGATAFELVTPSSGGGAVIQIDTFEDVTSNTAYTYNIPDDAVSLEVEAAGAGANGGNGSSVFAFPSFIITGGTGGQGAQHDTRFIPLTAGTGRTLAVTLGTSGANTTLIGIDITDQTWLGNYEPVNTFPTTSASGETGARGSASRGRAGVGGPPADSLSAGGGGGGGGWVEGNIGGSNSGNGTGGAGGHGGMVIKALAAIVNIRS